MNVYTHSFTTLSREVRAFFAALQFLSCVPIPSRFNVPERYLQPDDYARSLAWYPVVGLLMALLCLIPIALFSGQVSHFLLSTIVLSIWIGLTGALHLDGLADCTDAWVGGFGDRDRTLAILKDPRSGPMAIVVVCMTLLLKLAALSVVLQQMAWPVIVAVLVGSRCTLILIFQCLHYINPQGLGVLLTTSAARGRVRLMVSLCVYVAALLYFFEPIFLLVFTAVGWCVFLFWQRSCLRRLQGFNGDCAGALVEFLELAWLLSSALYLSYSPGVMLS